MCKQTLPESHDFQAAFLRLANEFDCLKNDCVSIQTTFFYVYKQSVLPENNTYIHELQV